MPNVTAGKLGKEPRLFFTRFMYFEFEVPLQFQNGDIEIEDGLFRTLSLGGRLCKQ